MPELVQLIPSALGIRSGPTLSSFIKALYNQMMELLNYCVSAALNDMKWRRGAADFTHNFVSNTALNED